MRRVVEGMPLRVLVLNPMEPTLEWRDTPTGRRVDAARATPKAREAARP